MANPASAYYLQATELPPYPAKLGEKCQRSGQGYAARSHA